nr:MAG TPA: hypothetical protein [Caudoviricetes sp.]DAY09905.1 MAG TPA: hypothetical protein [Caudoviricetes sp.]
MVLLSLSLTLYEISLLGRKGMSVTNGLTE